MSNNVVNIFAKKADKKEETEEAVSGNETFEEIAERNRKNKERMEKERLRDNKSVLRSYRIKN